MQILARAVGRRKEAVAQVQIIKGSGQFIINSKPAQQYLQNNSCSLISVKSPFLLCQLLEANGVTPFPTQKGGGDAATPSLVESNNLSPTTLLATKEALPSLGGPLMREGRRDAQKNVLFSFDQVDTIVKVKGGGLIGQADAIKLAVARAICSITDLKFISFVRTSQKEEQNTNAFSKVLPDRDEAHSLDGLEKPEANTLAFPRGATPQNLVPLFVIPHGGKEGAATLEQKGMGPPELSLQESVSTEHNISAPSAYEITTGARETNNLETIFKKQLKTKGYLTQDSRVKERRKYGLKKARKASQYHKR